MKIQAESKFSIGENIFAIKETYRDEICEKCEGTGKLELVIGGYVTCNDCDGRKIERNVYVYYWEVSGKYEIDSISTKVSKDKSITVTYGCRTETERSTTFIVSGEDELFLNLEDAQAECERRGERFEDDEE